MIRQLLTRLKATGYSTVALTHVVYGRPRALQDSAETILPRQLWEEDGSKVDLTVIRRLHAVVENLSDLSAFTTTTTTSSTTTSSSSSFEASVLLQGYDLVSVSPRTDGTFQEACAGATAVDIITIDYYSTGRGGLPFKMRSADIQAAINRGAVFEIPYGPAILQKSHRRAMIQACRELQMASLGLKPRIILSSGPRIFEERDIGAMTLRIPGDIVNLAKTVLRFDNRTFPHVCGQAGRVAVEHGNQRRFGKSIVVDLYGTTITEIKRPKTNLHQVVVDVVTVNNQASSAVPATEGNESMSKPVGEEDQIGDGFISF